MGQYDGWWLEIRGINNIMDPLLRWRRTTKYSRVLQIELASIKKGTLYINVILRSVRVTIVAVEKTISITHSECG